MPADIHKRRDAVVRTSQKSVDVFNARLKRHQKNVGEFNAKVPKHEQDVEAFNQHVSSFKESCANQAYYEHDMRVVLAEAAKKK
jgi:hypothetical protein